jgi:Ubiquitin elongating factor core
MVQKYDNELKILKSFRIGYELALCDMNMAKMIEKFFGTHMKLMRDWGHLDTKWIRFSELPGIFCHLPESYLQDMIEVMNEIVKINSINHKAFRDEAIIDVTEFCIAIL